jgi:hypothetical protein
MSNYISKCTAAANFNACIDKKGINQQSKLTYISFQSFWLVLYILVSNDGTGLTGQH